MADQQQEQQQQPLNQNARIERIRNILEDVPVKGAFSCGGALPADTVKPAIRITATDTVLNQYPLPVDNVRTLIDGAVLAPFGTHAETLTDTAVRNTWQLDPDTGFKIDNEADFGAQTLQPLLANIVRMFGLSKARAQNTELRLYKLLVYETGSHFDW